MSWSEVTAAVLAGGLGTRLRSAVADRPKVLAEVAGRPFLAYLLEQLLCAGLEETVLLTGYQANQVETAFGRSFGGMKLTYSLESTPLGTGGAVRQALPLLSRRTVLLLNGDSFCPLGLEAFRAAHREATATLALAEVADVSRYGSVRLDGDRITTFEEKGQRSGSGLVNAGVYLLDRSLIAQLSAGRSLSLEREALPGWTAAGLCRGYRVAAGFLDIGTPESYALAEGILRTRPASPDRLQ